MRLTEEEFARELRYQSATYFLRQMLDQGLISAEEYRQIDTRNCENMRPFTGSIISGKFLICAEIRANIGTGKEAECHENSDQNGAGTSGHPVP